jgi:hypothetical protein
MKSKYLYTWLVFFGASANVYASRVESKAEGAGAVAAATSPMSQFHRPLDMSPKTASEPSHVYLSAPDTAEPHAPPSFTIPLKGYPLFFYVPFGDDVYRVAGFVYKPFSGTLPDQPTLPEQPTHVITDYVLTVHRTDRQPAVTSSVPPSPPPEVPGAYPPEAAHAPYAVAKPTHESKKPRSSNTRALTAAIAGAAAFSHDRVYELENRRKMCECILEAEKKLCVHEIEPAKVLLLQALRYAKPRVEDFINAKALMVLAIAMRMNGELEGCHFARDFTPTVVLERLLKKRVEDPILVKSTVTRVVNTYEHLFFDARNVSLDQQSALIKFLVLQGEMEPPTDSPELKRV